MKNSIFNTITFLLLLITLISCNSEDNNEFVPTLPEATQIGANTFGCYVDGKLLTPRDGTGTVFGPDKGMRFLALGDFPNYIYNELIIRNFKDENLGIFKLHFDNIENYRIGTFSIKDSNCQDGIDANESINITCRWFGDWYCSIENSGSITISKYDFQNRIISGTFNCLVENNNSNEIIEITDGRFDIKWNVLNNSVIDFP